MPTETNDPHAASSVVPDGKELLKGALDSHQTITVKALDVIPHGARLTVYVLWTISALAAVTGIVFVVAGNQTFGFVIILVAFVSIMFSVYLQNKSTRTSPEQLGELARGQVSGPSWARVVPKVPIAPPEKLDGFQLSLRQIRTTAIAQLNEARKKAGRFEIDSTHVRINVFLVHTDNMADSGVLVLIIPRRLNDNMTNFRDRDIRILPHEGLTGRTFTLGEACGATAVPDATSRLNWSKVNLFPARPSSDEWDRFTLSEEQNALIDIRLRWIISFPLRYEGQGREKTFAVLNIDGIEDDLPIDDMRSLAGNIEPSVTAFAASMAVLPKVRITIRVEDVLQ